MSRFRSPIAPTTRREYERCLGRFQRFGGAPEAFLETLPVSSARVAYHALRSAGLIERPIRIHYWRDEFKLRETVLTPEERRRLAEAPLTARQRALVSSLYTLRRAEVAALRWRHLDLERGLVHVPRGKGGKPAFTMLPPTTVVALTRWRELAAIRVLAPPAPPEGRRFKTARQKFEAARPKISTIRPEPDDPVFPDRFGRPPSPRVVAGWVKTIFKVAGLDRPYRGCHSLRRTFASEFLKRHPGHLGHLQTLLRHSSPATTMRYIFLNPSDLAPLMEGLAL